MAVKPHSFPMEDETYETLQKLKKKYCSDIKWENIFKGLASDLYSLYCPDHVRFLEEMETNYGKDRTKWPEGTEKLYYKCKYNYEKRTDRTTNGRPMNPVITSEMFLAQVMGGKPEDIEIIN